MGVFLGLGGMKLAQPSLGDNTRQGHLHLVSAIGDCGIQSLFVGRHHDELQVGDARPAAEFAFSLRRQFVHDKGFGQLASAIRPEIVVDHRVTGLHKSNRMIVFNDDRGDDKFVGDVLIIRLLDGLHG